MNRDHFENLVRAAGRRSSLSLAERTKMRTVLTEYAQMKPVRDAAPIPSPYLQSIASVFATFANNRAAVALVLILLVGTSSVGAASIAESALPGDPLYTVKVSMIEPARLALSANAKSKVEWERIFAERRITEAAALADQDRLDTETEATLAANFEHYATLALQKEQPTDEPTPEPAPKAAEMTLAMRVVPPAALDLPAEDFSARLSAYESVLRELDVKRGKASTSKLRSVIRSQADKLDDTAPSEDVLDESHVAELTLATDSALDASATLVTTLPPSLATSTNERAQKALREAEAFRNEGKQLLAQHDARGASRAFKNSLKASARLNVLTHAAATLKVDAFAESDVHDASSTTATSTAPVLPTKPEPPRADETETSTGDHVEHTSTNLEGTSETRTNGSFFKLPFDF